MQGMERESCPQGAGGELQEIEFDELLRAFPEGGPTQGYLRGMRDRDGVEALVVFEGGEPHRISVRAVGPGMTIPSVNHCRGSTIPSTDVPAGSNKSQRLHATRVCYVAATRGIVSDSP